MSEWRFTSTSVQGTSHIQTNVPCQDFSLCKLVKNDHGNDLLVLVASDGAGSATYSDEGSRLVCEYFMEKLTRYIEQGWTFDRTDEDIVRQMFVLTRHAAQTIKRAAKKRGVEKREFAATLVLAIVEENKSIFLQLGDGGIVISTATENYESVFWPQSGEYANMTYFITDDSAIKNLQFKIINQKVNDIALFTDGIQGLALKYDTQSAYSPFFRPQFRYLRQVPEIDLPLVREQLGAFLNSKPVNDRTNDDKTLILACRLNDSI